MMIFIFRVGFGGKMGVVATLGAKRYVVPRNPTEKFADLVDL